MRLYPPEGAHWCSREDYRAILNVTQEIEAKRVLEFGPGTSTLALIEGGADWIDACEDNPVWFATYIERLEDRFPSRIALRPYNYRLPLFIPTVDESRYDLALIDGPEDVALRPAIIQYALARCGRVLVPLEEGGAEMPGILREFVRGLPLDVQWIENTGPLAGAFALLSA